MRSWREFKLGDVSEVIGGGTPKTAINEYWNGNIPWLTPRDLTGYDKVYISHGERHITDEGLKNSSAKLMPKGTVLLTSRAPIGYVAIAENEICTNQGFKSLVPNFEILNSEFLYYWLKSNTDYLQQLGTGTTFAEISGSVVKDIDISLPPLEEQKAIAEVLSSLDDKIDLLHRQNQTLESLAQTLFRQWFIEEVKEEWEEIKLGDFVDCITGYSYKSDDLNDSKNALVTLKNFARDGSFRLDGFKEFTGTKYKDSQIVKHGDLVVSHTDITQEADIIGNPVLVVDMGKYDNLIITMDLMKVESKVDWLSKEFLYYLFRTEDFKFHCLGNSNGTTVLHMSRKTIPEYKTKIPSIERIEEFTNDVKEILQKQYVNILQIQTLENLRDTLLPKLLSGEVRVKNE
ncbi:MAG: restriction endonuclease subunit S [Candidatus Cloacimonetes bacterium]|nr:restriction endonuclease subunit S [Candidatus Cloacimonadota bacterium]